MVLEQHKAMGIRDVLTLPCTGINVQGKSKKRVLEIATSLIERYNATVRAGELFNALLTREKLGSTGVGNGVALPHCQIDSCTTPVAAFLKLAIPVEFDAVDQKPVDLVFALVVPTGAEEENMNLLREVSMYLGEQDIQQQLRRCTDAQSLYHTLTSERTVKH